MSMTDDDVERAFRHGVLAGRLEARDQKPLRSEPRPVCWCQACEQYKRAHGDWPPGESERALRERIARDIEALAERAPAARHAAWDRGEARLLARDVLAVVRGEEPPR